MDKSRVFSGARLKRCREMRYGPGPTTQELAHDAIVTFAYIRKLEKDGGDGNSGKLKPQTESLQKICGALGISIDDLYVDAGADPLANLPVIKPKLSAGQARRAPSSPAPLSSTGNRDSLITQIVTSLPNLEDDLLERLIAEINQQSR